jgi:hypothetical protein
MERRVTKEMQSEVEGSGRWGAVILAWLLVGVPLLWGVWNTLLKAAALFRS